MSRYKYLRRCLVNLLILYFGIISAACFFGAITIYLAAVEYEHALQGPAAVAHSIAIAGSTAAWVSAVFGVLTIGSIIFRNFDNPQPESSQNSGEGGGMRRRFNRNASRTNHSGSEGAEQAQEARFAHAIGSGQQRCATRRQVQRNATEQQALAAQAGDIAKPQGRAAHGATMSSSTCMSRSDRPK